MKTGICQFTNKRVQNEDFIKASDSCIVLCDGHNGPDIAKELCSYLFECMDHDHKNSPADVQQCVAQFEELQMQDTLVRRSIIGSTFASVVLDRQSNSVLLSWIGDSQIILKFRQSQLFKSEKHVISPKSKDDKQFSPGSIINNRLGGVLRLSRAVGDFPLKDLGLRAQCDNSAFSASTIEFGMICSDGITDVMSPEQLVLICQQLYSDHADLDAGLRQLLAGNIEQYRSDNNIPSCLVPEILVEGRMTIEEKIATVLCQLAYFKGAEDNCSIVVFRL